MKDKICEVEFEKWSKIVEERSQFSIFFKPEYLKSIELSFKLNLKLYVLLDNGIVNFAAAVFCKNKNIVLPEYFSINPYWIDPELSEAKQITIQKEFIQILKAEFLHIAIKFNTDVYDLRPFKWAGFDVELKYTYQKNTSEEIYEKNISRHYKKAIEKYNLTAQPCAIDLINWKSHQVLFRTFYLTQSRVSNIYKWLNMLEEKGLLFSMNILNDKHVIVGSVVILIDKNKRIGYLLFLESSSNHQSEINAFLYIEVQKYLLKNDINVFDYLGANIPSIANYKSRFKPSLKSYYIVTYKMKYLSFQPLKNVVKQYLYPYLIK